MAFAGDIRQRDQIDWAEADAETKGGHAFRVIAACERWFAGGARPRAAGGIAPGWVSSTARPPRKTWPALRRAGHYRPDRSADQAASKSTRWNATSNACKTCACWSTTRTPAAWTPTPAARILCRYLSKNQPEAWQEATAGCTSNSKTACLITPKAWLAFLQPLYQAVVHGCRAGLYQQALDEVYCDRILRGTGSGGNYSTFKLGAIGADLGQWPVSSLNPGSGWRQSLSVGDQAWLLSKAAFSLTRPGPGRRRHWNRCRLGRRCG